MVSGMPFLHFINPLYNKILFWTIKPKKWSKGTIQFTTSSHRHRHIWAKPCCCYCCLNAKNLSKGLSLIMRRRSFKSNKYLLRNNYGIATGIPLTCIITVEQIAFGVGWGRGCNAFSLFFMPLSKIRRPDEIEKRTTLVSLCHPCQIRRVLIDWDLKTWHGYESAHGSVKTPGLFYCRNKTLVKSGIVC